MDDQPRPALPPESGPTRRSYWTRPPAESGPTRPSYWTPAPAGKSFAEIRMAVNAGGRLVVYEYCLSIVVLSFKQTSAIRLVPPGRNRIVPGLRYSLVSLVLGWWGIPWGPFWTVQTIIRNLRGGTDVTNEILALDPTRLAGTP